MVVISFHSLEDRIVKERFNKLSKPVSVPKWVMTLDEEPSFKVVAKKIRASELELKENTRSRSAILRCLERLK
jgi:16S rRNA (cytosine1402-N4)-methyltransferase